jgi:hypothetical protein
MLKMDLQDQQGHQDQHPRQFLALRAWQGCLETLVCRVTKVLLDRLDIQAALPQDQQARSASMAVRVRRAILALQANVAHQDCKVPLGRDRQMRPR